MEMNAHLHTQHTHGLRRNRFGENQLNHIKTSQCCSATQNQIKININSHAIDIASDAHAWVIDTLSRYYSIFNELINCNVNSAIVTIQQLCNGIRVRVGVCVRADESVERCACDEHVRFSIASQVCIRIK